MPDHFIKLFVDAHVFDQEYQGTRTFIKGIYKEMLNKTDIQFYFAAYDIDNLRRQFAEADNIHFIKYKSQNSSIRLLYEIPGIIKKYGIEYAHFQYIAPPIKNCKFIVTTHDVVFKEYPAAFSLPYRISKTFLYKIAALRADILTTVSSYSADAIQKYLGIQQKPILTPNGVSDCYFEEYDKGKARRYIFQKYGFDKFILYVSRIEPRKNHAFLLKAYLEQQLYVKGYYLVLLGQRTLRTPAFDKLLTTLSPAIRRFVYINTHVDDCDLMQFYRAAALFVYPSVVEGFGIPPLEAAACKTPVLCSNASAMQAFHFFGKGHVNPLLYDEFKARLKEMIEAPPDDAALTEIAETVYKQYSWPRSAENLYQTILNLEDQKKPRYDSHRISGSK